MPLPRVLFTGLASAVLGAALWVSAGTLDRVVTAAGSTRLALLPAWPAWVAFVAVSLLVFWTLHRRWTREPREGADMRSVHDAALSGCGAGLLLLPYLPWLPDRVPALQALAGPLRLIVWLLVLTQVVWVLWRPSPTRFSGPSLLTTSRLGMLAGLVTLAVSGAATMRLVATPAYPGGDEPHYLVIAQSLWRDGDLAIENNHERGDYREYYPQDLEPHYLTRGLKGVIYSIHPIGLPILLAPVYAAGGYPLTVLFLLLLASIAGALMWRYTAVSLQDRSAALFGLAAVVGSAPFLLNSFTVYPEIAAGLAVVVGFTASASLSTRATSWVSAISVGAAAAILPWMSTKYAPMSAVLVAVACTRVLVRWPPMQRNVSPEALLRATVVLTPYLLSLAAWLLFFERHWGIALPQAPYGALVQTNLKNIVFGVPGLLFDQEYGVLPYAPVYVLAVTGAAAMWRRGGEGRRHAIELALMGAALLGTVGAFRIWWGGSASPGRPLASGLLLLVLPIAAAFRAAEPATARRAAQHLLLWTSIGLTMVMVVAQEGGLINNGRDGSSSLIEFLSPLWHAWVLAPSFIHHEAATAALHALAWLSLAAGAAVILRRITVSTRGAASAAALMVYAATAFAATVIVPRLPADPPQAQLDLRARARLPALDGFDSGARPLAVLYDPFRIVPLATTLPLLTLEVETGSRRERQPVRLLHNGRFSVPAGTYRVEGVWSDEDAPRSGQAAVVDLQLGRIGPPLARWSFDPHASTTWREDVSLPIDAPFLGFRGDADVERSLTKLLITPLAVVDQRTRPRTLPVLAAARYANALVFFHDGQTFPEPSGFWSRGGHSSSVTVASAAVTGPSVSLRLHPGPRPNHAVLTGYGWRFETALQPGAPVIVPLPESARRTMSLEIATATGFVPSEIDPRAGDRRRLGAWVEVVK